MKHIIFLVAFAFYSVSGFTQGWNHRFGGTGQESNYKVLICADGGFVSVGSTKSFSLTEDLFVHKTDSLGKFVWQKFIGGNATEKGYAVAEDATGNLYVVGETNSTGAGGKDFYVVKLSSSGNILWTNTYGGVLDDYATGIVINGSNIYISGTSKNFGSGLDDIYLIKINASGTLVYANAFGTANTEISRCMAPVHDGGLLIGGTISYGTTTTGYLVRTNANGDSLWTRIINVGSRNAAGIYGCTELLGDSVFAMTGYGGSTLYGNMVSARVNLSGTTLSINTSGLLADDGVGITKTSDGGFATAGTYANFGVRAVITKFSYLGDKLWDIRLVQPNGLSYVSFSNGIDISETSDHGFILSGINNLSGTPSGAADLMLVKTDSLGNIPQQLYIQPTITGSASRCIGDSAQISVPSGFDHYKWFRFYTPNYSFMWIPDESSNSIYVDSSGYYGCVMYDEDGIYISSSVLITVYKNPDVTLSASGSIAFCNLNDTLTLSVPAVTSVNYLWNKNGIPISGATAASYNPTSSGNYTVTAYNYCDSIVSATVSVNSNAPPDVTTSVDTLYSNYFLHGNSVCGSESMSIPFQSGVSYMWYRNGYTLQQTNNVNTIANAAGSYYVIATNPCGTDTSDNVIIITDTVYSTLTYSGPVSGCGSAVVTLYAPEYASATYDWFRNGTQISGGNLSNFYHPASTGDYYCKITKPCIAFTSVDYTDTISVNYSTFQAPTVTGANGYTACSGSLPLTINTTANSYQWYKDSVLIPGATAQTYNATTSGNYYCVISNASCSSISTYPRFMRFGAPDGSISTSNTAICGNTYTALTLNSPDRYLPGFSVQWRKDGIAIPNATNPNYSTNIAAVYDCEISNACGSYITNAITLTSTNVTVQAINGNSLCPGVYKSLVATNLAGYTYQWYTNSTNPIPGATQPTLLVNTSNNYFVSATNGSCNLTSNTLYINNSNSNNPDIFCATVPKFCGADSVQLITEQRPDFTYQWYRGGTILSGQIAASIYASIGGDYEVQVTDSNNCTVTSPPQFVGASNVGNFSIIPIGSLTICDAGSTVLNAGFAGNSYQWSYYGVPISGANQANHTASDGGLYGVTVTDAQGCTGYASVFVYKNSSPTISVNTITTASCSQANGGAQINYVPNGTYLWSTGATYTTINSVPSGTYTVTVTTNFCSSSLQIQIPATNYLSPSITGDTTICSGDSSMINAGPFLVYLWSTGQSTQYIHPTATGWYTVTVSDPALGCSGIDSIYVTVSPSPVVTIAANGPISFCLGDSVLLDAGTGFNTYKWYRYGNLISGATAQTYYAKTAGPHQCKASISNGCDDLSNIINIRIPCMPPQDEDVRIEEEATGDIGVYPNPSSGIYHIEIPEVYKKPFRISVTDLLGKSLIEEISQNYQLVINLTTFQEGIYLLKINDGSKSDVMKLVKYD